MAECPRAPPAPLRRCAAFDGVFRKRKRLPELFEAFQRSAAYRRVPAKREITVSKRDLILSMAKLVLAYSNARDVI